MNKETAERYVNEYGKNLYSFCRYCTRDLDAANELYQQTFLVAFEKDELEENANPVSYLITIAVNLWKNRLRKAAWRKKIADVRAAGEEELAQIADAGPSVEEEVEQKQERERVRECVRKLPEKYRIVILMFYMEDMSIAEIASALKIPEGTVKSRMNMAKKMLKESLQNGEEGFGFVVNAVPDAR